MATLPNPLPRLTADPSGRALGLDLPPGGLVDTTIDGPWHEPLLWRAEDRTAPGDWAALSAARNSGLLPVLLDLDDAQDDLGGWELAPDEMSYAGDHDPEEVLAEFWEEHAAYEPDADEDRPGEEEADEVYGRGPTVAEMVAPYGPLWPGLAAATPLDADPNARAAEIADSLARSGSWLKRPRLALVPARRSADIPAAIGWSGPLNHENDVARLCAVLRSWEDRFGIRVIALAFDRLVLSVAAPPTTTAEAEAVAAEHFAFCPDNIAQGDHDTLREYAEHEVLNGRVWSFWWD
ncbi:hypothetical protein CW362_31415 [Streptomyces populi]|uniref:DUF4253 domain-containing protein n=1 Tax=Streptomyces populi TaxID=2058924 RepID=A0A2I0SGT8_9ACTN|nr:DUF4253 domain-containing protein [Streptomyces populi]PKT69099.1 hypothetical protein CW362_31415 [Streptomyces populi]